MALSKLTITLRADTSQLEKDLQLAERMIADADGRIRNLTGLTLRHYFERAADDPAPEVEQPDP